MLSITCIVTTLQACSRISLELNSRIHVSGTQQSKNLKSQAELTQAAQIHDELNPMPVWQQKHQNTTNKELGSISQKSMWASEPPGVVTQTCSGHLRSKFMICIYTLRTCSKAVKWRKYVFWRWNNWLNNENEQKKQKQAEKITSGAADSRRLCRCICFSHDPVRKTLQVCLEEQDWGRTSYWLSQKTIWKTKKNKNMRKPPKKVPQKTTCPTKKVGLPYLIWSSLTFYSHFILFSFAFAIKDKWWVSDKSMCLR